RHSDSSPTQRSGARCGLLSLPAVRREISQARLLEAGIAFPRTHDLLQLLNACVQIEPLWSAFAKVVDRMSNYAVDFRYPGNSATTREAKMVLKHSRSLRA